MLEPGNKGEEESDEEEEGESEASGPGSVTSSHSVTSGHVSCFLVGFTWGGEEGAFLYGTRRNWYGRGHSVITSGHVNSLRFFTWEDGEIFS